MNPSPQSKWLGTQPDGTWEPPPRDECEETRIPTTLKHGYRISMRRVEWNKQLMEYAIVLSQSVTDGDWVEIASIDTLHHGTVHRHDGADHSTSYIPIRDINSQQDVQDSFKSSFTEIYNVYVELTKGLDA